VKVEVVLARQLVVLLLRIPECWAPRGILPQSWPDGGRQEYFLYEKLEERDEN